MVGFDNENDMIRAGSVIKSKAYPYHYVIVLSDPDIDGKVLKEYRPGESSPAAPLFDIPDPPTPPMKITDIRVVSRGFPQDFPLVEVDTDAGITGIGATASWTRPVSALLDSSPELPGPEPPFRGLLLGADPTRPAELWRRLFDGGWFGRGDEGGIAVNALAAVDIALWDIAGKAAGLPVHRLVGDVVQNQIMVYASTSAFPHDYYPEAPRRRTAREMIAECATYRERGFKAVKLGWGNHFSAEDEETLAAIREGIGPEMLLMLDFGCPAYLDPGHTVDDAVRAAEVAGRYGVHFLEPRGKRLPRSSCW